MQAGRQQTREGSWPNPTLVRHGRGTRDAVIGGLQGQKLLAVDRDVTRRLDPQANFTPINIDDRNADVIADVDLFSELTAEDQHVATLLRAKQWLTPVLYATNARS